MITMLSSWTSAYLLFMSLSSGVLSLGHLSANSIFNDLQKWKLEPSSCSTGRFTNDLGGIVKCHCNRDCSRFGTCCADSRYRTRYGLGTGGFSCIDPNRFEGPSEGVFMLDRCRPNWYGEDFVQDLCLGDAEALNDPLLLIPATSPRSGITYRNIFCFTCNEDFNTVSPVLWKLWLAPTSLNISEESVPDLQYSPERRTWTVSSTGDGVVLRVNTPDGFEKYVVRCLTNTIQTCAGNWTDFVTQDKCESYMDLTFRSSRVFRNPHCAACNFVDPTYYPTSTTYTGSLPPIIREFYVDYKNRCPREMMFDHFKKRCRLVKCGQNQGWYQGECRTIRLR